MHVSIIIPTLNEAAYLERTLRCLSVLHPLAWEIVVVDGGSDDQTVAITKEFSQTFAGKTTIQVVSSKRGRSRQLNAGAEIATGDVLCFLHADTVVPDDLIAVVCQTLENPAIACGGFISLMTGANRTQWLTSLHNFLKTYYAPLLFRPHLFVKGLRLLFGDQVMFCRRKDFWDCGGFDPAMPIMEEADLCLKLTSRGRIQQINRVVLSSDRRVAKWGFLRANAIYLGIGCLWGMGISATYLKRFYDEVR